jgi:hypothetical protein
MRGCIAKHSEKSLRALTLFFVEKILVVEAAISEISVQRFRGQPLLFSDSAAKLKEQLDLPRRHWSFLTLWQGSKILGAEQR